jgi:mycoredoxin-dependent peroxiredoxin
MTLQEGLPVPDFELQDQHGRSVVLSSFRGTHAVVLMFYPFAFSRVCTGELSEVRDNQAMLVSADVQLLAVSCDPMFALRTFADRDGLEFPLLSDFWPHGKVSRAFGVFDEKRGCARRSTFIVDRDGVLRWSVHNPNPEARDLTAYIRVLADLAEGR